MQQLSTHLSSACQWRLRSLTISRACQGTHKHMLAHTPHVCRCGYLCGYRSYVRATHTHIRKYMHDQCMHARIHTYIPTYMHTYCISLFLSLAPSLALSQSRSVAHKGMLRACPTSWCHYGAQPALAGGGLLSRSCSLSFSRIMVCRHCSRLQCLHAFLCCTPCRRQQRSTVRTRRTRW